MSSRVEDSGEYTVRITLQEILDGLGEKEKRVSHALVALTGSSIGRTFRLTEPVNVIGRGEGVEIRIDEDGVSRRHAQVERNGEGWLLNDLASTNGTVCNGARVDGPIELHEGDRIRLASTVLRFETADELAEEMRARLFDLATRDSLTGAYNRRFLNERLTSEWAWTVRHSRPCSALAIDIDHFKRVNDTWGHPAGDHVLKDAVSVMKRSVRQEDLLARYGGEEFVVLCRATDLEQAAVVAERLRANLEAHEFVWERTVIPVTVSVGVASSECQGVSSQQGLLSLADARLYRAKDLGRNRVEFV